MKFLCFFFFFQVSLLALGQEFAVGYIWEERIKAESLINSKDSYTHTGFFPFIVTKQTYDSLFYSLYGITYINQKHKYWQKSLVQVKDSDFILHINPLLTFTFKNDSTKHFAENTRGLLITGQLSDKFFFVSGATETQAFYPEYIKTYQSKNLVIPGNGRVRPFKKTGYDFSKAFGHVVYSPTQHWHFMLGHSKQFFGYGYRSLLLSDAPLEYPVIKTTYTNKRFKYSFSYASFQSASAFDDRTKVHSRIFSSMHYLSFFIHRTWQVALFENTLFQPMSAKNNRPAEEFYIPILFIHSSLYGFNNTKNVMTAIQSQWSPFKSLSFYGQFVLDDYSKTDSLRKKIAWQYGFKLSEPLGIKNFWAMVETNRSLPYTYSSSYKYSMFTQHNEPIAHILGNNFVEYILRLHYSYKILLTRIEWNKATYCPTEKRLSVSSTSLLQTIEQIKVESGILIHKPSRLQLLIGYRNRTESGTKSLHYWYLSLTTRFFNFYDDF